MLHTHVHIDHIGWNTYRDGHQWVPTFANARHVLTEVERQYWDMASIHYNPAELSRTTIEKCFEESMLPVIREGMVDVIGVDAQIDDMLRYVAVPITRQDSLPFVSNAMARVSCLQETRCITYFR